MKRLGRWLLILPGVGLAGLPVAFSAGPPRIALLSFNEMGCPNRAVEDGLRELHYYDGQNIKIDCRHVNGRYADLDALAVLLVQSKPDVIVTIGHAQSLAAQRATHEIPIVMLASGEPVEAGLIASFKHPGANVTGLSYFSTELNLKRLEYFKTMIPNLQHLAVLIDPAAPVDLNGAYLRDARLAGRKLGFEVTVFETSSESDLNTVFASMAAQKMQAVFIPPKLMNPGEIERIVILERRHRMPVMHYVKTFVEIGGLMSYGADYPVLQRRAAIYVDKILRGAKPSDLPVEQPKNLLLCINLKAARELGIQVPEALLARADRVID